MGHCHHILTNSSLRIIIRVSFWSPSTSGSINYKGTQVTITRMRQCVAYRVMKHINFMTDKRFCDEWASSRGELLSHDDPYRQHCMMLL